MSQYASTKTKDVRLFSAVAAMGVPWTEETAAVAGGERVWLFGEVSDCGLWKLKDLLAWWHDKLLGRREPNNLFNVAKSCMGSDRGFRDAIKTHSGWNQRKVGKSFTVDVVAEPMIDDQTLRTTTSVELASALSAVGFRVTPGKPQGTVRVFCIGSHSETFGYAYDDAVRWWEDKTFEERNGQHPFAYAKSVAITYSNAVQAIQKAKPLIKWRPKGSIGTAFIHPDCSTRTEEKVATWLQGK